MRQASRAPSPTNSPLAQNTEPTPTNAPAEPNSMGIATLEALMVMSRNPRA